jgi:hypothetical protein
MERHPMCIIAQAFVFAALMSEVPVTRRDHDLI